MKERNVTTEELQRWARERLFNIFGKSRVLRIDPEVAWRKYGDVGALAEAMYQY